MPERTSQRELRRQPKAAANKSNDRWPKYLDDNLPLPPFAVDFVAELRDHDVNNSSSQDHLDQNRLTFRLLPTLVTSIGVLVLLSVGSVLIVNWVADRRIVREFASRLVTRVLSAEERSLRAHLDAAVNQGDFIAAAISSGRFQLGEPALTDFVSGTLAAVPQVLRIACERP